MKQNKLEELANEYANKNVFEINGNLFFNNNEAAIKCCKESFIAGYNLKENVIQLELPFYAKYSKEDISKSWDEGYKRAFSDAAKEFNKIWEDKIIQDKNISILFAEYFSGEKIEYNSFAGTYKDTWVKNSPIFNSIDEVYKFWLKYYHNK